MTRKPDTDRRSVLKALGGIGAAGVVGGGSLLALSGGAAATNTLSITDSTATVDDGQLSYVDVAVSGTLSWDGFDTPVDALRFVSEIRLPDHSTGWHLLNDATSDSLANWSTQGSSSDGWGGDDEYVVSLGGDNAQGQAGEVHTGIDWRVIGDSPKSIETPAAWQDYFSVGTDGGSKTTTVEKRSAIYFLDANGNLIGADTSTTVTSEADAFVAAATATFAVTVDDQASTSTSDTSGSSSSG